MLTLSQIIAYCRAETGELDAKRVDDIQITRYINFAQLKVQNEFAQVDFKAFTKTAYFTGATFAEPSDLLKYPNSIINLLACAGNVRALTSFNYTTPTASITHTLKEAGTNGNGITVNADAGTYSGSLTSGMVSALIVAGQWYFDFGAGSTITQIINGFNSNPIYSTTWICSSGTSGGTIPVPSVGQIGTTLGGTGTGYYPADETSIENFVRIVNNPFKSAVVTQPKFRRIGIAGTQLIEIAPNTVTFCSLEYYYRLPDLSANTDILAIPAEIEELVMLDVQRRIYEKLEMTGKMATVTQEYETKWKQYIEGYINKRTSETAEKDRLQTTDVNN